MSFACLGSLALMAGSSLGHFVCTLSGGECFLLTFLRLLLESVLEKASCITLAVVSDIFEDFPSELDSSGDQ